MTSEQSNNRRPVWHDRLRRIGAVVAGAVAVTLALIVLPGIAAPDRGADRPPEVSNILRDLRTEADEARETGTPAKEPNDALVAKLREQLREDAERGGTADAVEETGDGEGDEAEGDEAEGDETGGDETAGDNPIAGAPAEFIAAQRGDSPDLGMLNIPALGLQVPYASGVHDAVLERGPGHWPGTALPGQNGNAVISGHRTTFTAPFNKLDQLKPGDHVGATVNGQSETVYRVTESAIVPEAQYVDFILTPPAEEEAKQLTLFACHPEGSRTHRIVVRAVVEQSDSTAAAPTAPTTGRG